MKTRTKIVFYLSCLIIILLLAFYKGLFAKFNFVTAYYGILIKDYRIAAIGELGLYEQQEWIIAPKLGFKIDRTYGCNVDAGIINGVKDYNKIMGNYIDKHICKNWSTILEHESILLYSKDSLALSIVNIEDLKQQRNDISKKTNINLAIDNRDTILYQLSGYGYNDSLQKTFKYFEIIVNIKDKTIKTLKNTNIEINE